MRLRSLLLVALLSACAGRAGADSLGDSPVAYLVERSSWGIEGKVLAISSDCDEERGCDSYRVRLEVPTVHFGSLSLADRKVDVCTRSFLEIGHTDHLFATMAEVPPTSGDNCTSMIGRDGVFEERADRVWRVRSPNSRITIPALERVYGTDSVVHPHFHEELKEAIKHRAITSS